MSINLTLVIQGLAFFAVAWIVMKFGWPHILGAIEERQKKIADGLAAAEQGRRELSTAEEESAKIVRAAREQAAGIRDQAQQQAVKILEQAKNDAVGERQRQLATAESEIGTLADRARDQLRTQVATLAVAGAGRLLGREVDAKAHQDLIDQLIAEL